VDYSIQGETVGSLRFQTREQNPMSIVSRFSRQKHAYIVQATSPEEVRWKEWEKECGGRLFAMKCFTEKEAKALRSVIIASDVIHSL
jgi:hypothetical protein